MRSHLFILLIPLLPIFIFGQTHNPANTTGTIYDTCRTYLYYQQIGKSGTEIQIAKARSVQDDGIINIGYTLNGGDRDALVIKQDRNGDKIWQKSFGLPAYDEEYTGFRELYNQNLLLIGIVKNKATQKKAMMLSKLSATGNLIWQKTYANFQAVRNIQNAKLYPGGFGSDGCFFAAESDSAIIYGMIDSSGNMLWQHSIRSDTGTHLVDVSANAGDLLIATNSFDSAHHVVKMYYINYYWNGNTYIKYTKRFGGYYNNSNYILHDMEQSGLFSYFSGIRSINNQPYELVRININQGYIGQALENIITPGVVIDSTALAVISIYADCIAFSANRRSKDIYMIKMTSSGEQTTYINWAFKTSWPDSIALNGCLKTWDAGYNIFGSNDRPAPDKNIIQLKIDSAGIVPGCIARITENFSIARNNFPGDTSAYNYVTDSMVPYAYSIAGYNMLSLDTTIFCKELKCPFLPLADTCVKSFFRLYQGYNPLNISEGITEINGAIYIGGGDNQLDYHPNSGNSFILKLNSDGHILKQRNYLIGDGNFGYLRKGNDSTLILYGEMDSAYYYYSFVAKVDTNLNISWIKILPFGIYPTSPNTFNIVDVKQYSDGSYFALVYEEYGIIYHRTLLIKLNANGGFIWTKSYTFPPPSGGYNQIVGSKLAINGGDVYVLCSNRYNNIAESILLKVDQNNGNVFWCKKFADPDDRLDISDLMSVYNNEIFFSGIVGQYPYKNVILKTDLNGNVIQAISHAIPNSSSTLRYSSAQNTDGTLSLVCDFYPANVYPFINKTGCDIKLDANLAIRYSRERPFAYLRDRDYLVSAADQSLYETGYILSPYQQSSQTNFYLMKYSPDGNLGVCPSDTFVFTVTPVPITVSSVNYIQSDTVFNVRTPFSYATQQHYMAEARQICSSVQGCDTLKIQGQDTICNNIAVFNAYRNSGCNAPVQWDIDQSEAQVIYSDDSIIYLQFLKTGNIKLYATLYSNCMPLKDSLKIYVLSSPPTLNLGPDTILCNNAAIILNAHKGFKTYLWQDGSVDSVFTVTAGGLYFVTVTDSCNNVFADSIIVSPDSYTPFDLGPDTAKCNKDTILLQINSGFNNYLWSPIVNMIFVTPTIVKVFPNNTMYYYVTARKANGCILKDSIKIIVNLSPIINLGADTSICRGDSLKLNAGGGFLNYLWSTGQNTSIIYVKIVGLYYVLATDANNCSSKDSLSILQLFPSPALHLSNDSLICTGQNKIFDAGPGFSSYLWNTGSTRRTISISSIGDYWVRVYDSKGCKNSDTIHIRQQQLPPSRFLLFSDTTLCQYDTISIKANRIFSSYLWSNGSSQPVITTSVPGLYWLQVTDQEGCIGKDTTTIMPKACYKKIYFPNSFTPNQDGINDIYKPKVFGYLDYYHIIIYNRWGQKVFESFDPNKGWDGEFKVLKQEYSAFVWECSYKFKDEKMQFKQGTFLLLR